MLLGRRNLVITAVTLHVTALIAVHPVRAQLIAASNTVPGPLTIEGLLTVNSGMIATQTGSGSALSALLLSARTENSAPSSAEHGQNYSIYNVNFAGGGMLGFDSTAITVSVTGDRNGNGPVGDVYPLHVTLHDNALRNVLSREDGSQDTNVQSAVFKSVPTGGVPPGRSMRDAWLWWGNLWGANLPSSQAGADLVVENDYSINGLDDAGRRGLDQLVVLLNKPLAQGGYPVSINVARYTSAAGSDSLRVWAHDWQQTGGNFSHSALDLFYAGSNIARITSPRPERPVNLITVDNIMPLESGGSSGGVDFPIASTAGIIKRQRNRLSKSAIELEDTNYISKGMFVYDETSPSRITDGTRVMSVENDAVALSENISSSTNDTLLFARGRKHVHINGDSYVVAGVVLAGPGTTAGTVYFTTNLSAADAMTGALIYPNAHAIWLCSGSSDRPWCDIAFDGSGMATLRSDGKGGVMISGQGLTDEGSLGVHGATTLAGLLTASGGINAPSIGNGAANFKVSGPGAWTRNGSTVTSLGDHGPAGVHNTVQEWLTLLDADGRLRYIPAF